MKTLSFVKLQHKILIYIVLVTIILAVITTVMSFINEFDRSEKVTEVMINQLLDTVEKAASEAIYARNQPAANDLSEGLLKNDIVQSVQFTSNQGFDFKRVKEKNIALEKKISHSFYKPFGKEIIRQLYSPFGENRVIGAIRITPSAEYSLREGKFSAILQTLNSIALIMVTAFIILWVIQVRFSTPLTLVSNTLHAIKKGEKQLIPLLLKNQNDELGRLVVDINNLLMFLDKQLNDERLLREKVEHVEQQLRLIFNSTSAGLFLLDENGMLLTSNATLKSILKIPELSDTALTHNHSIESFFNEKNQLHCLINKALQSGQLENQDFSLCQDTDKPAVWLHCLISKVVNAEGKTHLEGVLFDVTARVENEALIRHEADHDALTGLLRRQPTQAAFETYLATTEKPKVTLFLMDLDGFKQVNDNYGHLAGDKVLMIAAQRLKECVRETDIVARLGGDEFLILLINCNFANCKVLEIAENIVRAIQKPMMIDENSVVNVGVSLGIVSYAQAGQSFEWLCQAADQAMYEVKRHGKNGYCVYAEETMTAILLH